MCNTWSVNFPIIYLYFSQSVVDKRIILHCLCLSFVAKHFFDVVKFDVPKIGIPMSKLTKLNPCLKKNGQSLKIVDNFKFPGAWTEDTSTDFAVRKALAWNTCHKKRKIWSLYLPRKMRILQFLSIAESVFVKCKLWKTYE